MTGAGITTERLRGERPRRDHAALYAQLFGSDAVAATLWPPPHGGARSPEQAHELLAQDVAHWDSEGFGPWLFFETAGARFAGHAGLRCGTVGGAPSVEVLLEHAGLPHWFGRLSFPQPA